MLGYADFKEKYDAFMDFVTDIGYSGRYARSYEKVMKDLEQYLSDRSITEYTKETGNTFLKHIPRKPNEHKHYGLVIRRFDDFTFENTFIWYPPVTVRTCPEQFREVFTEYIENLKQHYYQDRTIAHYRDNMLKTLNLFDTAGIKQVQNITPDDIYSAFERASNKGDFSAALRSFLRYMHETKRIETDLSLFVPSRKKRHPVPSVYTKPEVEKLLGTFDKETKSGKRGYAITLLALRLGMCAIDIADLKMNDIDSHSKTISFIRRKTQTPQRLELLPEIEVAIHAYIDGVRPKTSLPNLFVSLLPPVRPIKREAVKDITRKHFDLAAIEAGDRKRGPHSLRMTLASELVSENVPYDAVRKILGHENPVTIKNYVKFDIDGLRKCAVDVPPLSAKLADYLQTGNGEVK